MKLPVYTPDGSEAGRQVELDDAVFGLEPNDHAIWLDVRAIQAHKRQGTHKTKERSEVAKSRRKLYRQKGTGNARAGDAKSPLRKGGGTIFGPRPHEYKLQVNRKTKQLARRSALAHKLSDGSVRVVEALQLDAPKTREVVTMLKGNVDGARRVLVLTEGIDDVFYRSARNIQGVAVLEASQASTLDLLSAHAIVLQEGAVDALTSALRPSTKATANSTESTPVETAPEPEAAPEPAPVEEEAAPEAEVSVEADAPEADASEEAAPEAAVAEEVAPEADDLTDVWGIGPVFASALADHNITTFAALAETDLETLRGIIAADTEGSDGSANEESWAEQARFLADGDQAGFDAYVASLKADDSDDA